MSVVRYGSSQGDVIVTSDTPLPTTNSGGVGTSADEAAGTDTGTFSLISLFKRHLQKFTNLLLASGAPSDAAWSSGDGSIVALLKAIATQAISTDPAVIRLDPRTTSSFTRAYDDGSTAAEESLVSATASQTTRVYRAKVTAAGACYVRLLSGSGGTELRRWTFPAAGAYVDVFDGQPYAVTGTNTALYWDRSAAVACTIEIDYVKSA